VPSHPRPMRPRFCRCRGSARAPPRFADASGPTRSPVLQRLRRKRARGDERRSAALQLQPELRRHALLARWLGPTAAAPANGPCYAWSTRHNSSVCHMLSLIFLAYTITEHARYMQRRQCADAAANHVSLYALFQLCVRETLLLGRLRRLSAA